MIRARVLMLAAVGLGLALAGCREVAGPSPVLSNHRAVYAVLEVGSAQVRFLRRN